MKKLTTETKTRPAIQIEGAALDENEGIKRKWRVEIDPEKIRNIEEGRERYDKYLKLHNNTSNK